MRDQLCSWRCMLALFATAVAGGCAQPVLGDWPTEVQGLVLAEDGQPINRAFVSLEAARFILIGNPPAAGIETVSDGRFVIRGVRPGAYIARFNAEGPSALWPFAEAASPVFIVEEGKVSVAPTLKARRERMIKIEGIVHTRDGTPIQDASLDFWFDFPDGGQAHSVRAKSDNRGRFLVELARDGRYIVRVGPEGQDWGRTAFVASGELVTVTAQPR